MTEILFISFREALQCVFLIYLILSHKELMESSVLRLYVLLGVAFAFFSGCVLNLLGFAPDATIWAMLRYLVELSFGYGAVLLAVNYRMPDRMSFKKPLLFVLGLLIFFFEAQGIGFYAIDIGNMKESIGLSILMAVIGVFAGFSLLFLYRTYQKRVSFVQKGLNWPVILVFVYAFKVAAGGLGELTKEDMVTTLNRGIDSFLKAFLGILQNVLMLEKHPFLKTDYSGVFDFFVSERLSMSLTVIVLMAPVVVVLMRLFSMPDPLLYKMKSPAEKRLRIAEFRKELTFKSILPFAGFLILLVMLHTSSITASPLFDPVAVPVKAADEQNILIPLKGRLGDITDGRLHKYLYFWGNREIVFLIIVKSDGSVGVALDQCEICNPPKWNKAAQGYAQKGKYLVCKYCMTPIAPDTVNKPGGCNPIPVPFKLTDDAVQIKIDDLVRVFTAAENLQKKGSHL